MSARRDGLAALLLVDGWTEEEAWKAKARLLRAPKDEAKSERQWTVYLGPLGAVELRSYSTARDWPRLARQADAEALLAIRRTIAPRPRTHRWERDWIEVRSDQVRKGDVLANHASVTHVYTGPKVVTWGGDQYELEDGDCFIACGNGMPHGMAISCTAADNRHVVGRNPRRVPVEAES